MSEQNAKEWQDFLLELNTRNAAFQSPATPQEPICGTCGKPASDGDTYVQCGPCHWASTPSPEGQTADELRRIAAHIRTPGNIWAEDAIDEIARLLENRARQLSPLPSPPTPEGGAK